MLFGCCNTKMVQNVATTFCTWTKYCRNILAGSKCRSNILYRYNNTLSRPKCRCDILYCFGVTTTPRALGVVVTPKWYKMSQRHFVLGQNIVATFSLGQNVALIICSGQNIATIICSGQNFTVTFCPGQNIVMIICPAQIIAAVF